MSVIAGTTPPGRRRFSRSASGSPIRRFATAERPVDEVANQGDQPVVTAKVRIENTGHTPGADVAQLYLGQPAAAGNPPRQLVAFQRVSLRPGQSRTVTFTLRGLQLAYYDTAAGSWRIAAGRYEVWIGDSSALAQLPVRLSFRIDRSVGTSP